MTKKTEGWFYGSKVWYVYEKYYNLSALYAFISWDFDAIPASTASFALYQMLMEDINELRYENFDITDIYLVQYIQI